MNPTECPNCYSPNASNAKFCNQCGRSFARTETDAKTQHSTPLSATESVAYRAGRAWKSWGPAARTLIIGSGFFLLLIISFLILGVGQPSPTNESATSSAPNVASTAQAVLPPARMKASDYMDQAKNYLSHPQAQEDLDHAKNLLLKISSEASEYAQAQGLITAIDSGRFKLPSEFELLHESAISALGDINSEITYAKLKKNADRYDGDTWEFSGKILEIQERGGFSAGRVGVGSYGMDAIYFEGNFTSEFVENSRVYVLGKIKGSKTYDTVAGWTLTIPYVQVIAMLSPSEAARLKAAGRKGESKPQYEQMLAEVARPDKPQSEGHPVRKSNTGDLSRRKAEARKLLEQ